MNFKNLLLFLIGGVFIFSSPGLQAEVNPDFAFQLFNEGLYEQALTQFKEIYYNDPANKEIKFQIALTYHLMNDNFKAIKELEGMTGVEVENLREKCRWCVFPVNKTITCILAGEHYLFIGTTSGLLKFDYGKGRWWTYDLRNGLVADDYIKSISSDGNILYLGTQKRGLSIFNLESEKCSYVLGPMEGGVTKILNDNDFVYIITDYNELYSMEKATKRFSKLKFFDSSIRNAFDEGNFLYVQTEKELFRFNKERKNWDSVGPGQNLLGSDYLSSSAIDLGNVWLGTRNGKLLVYEKILAREWKEFPLKTIVGKEINQIKSDSYRLYFLSRSVGTGGIIFNEAGILNIKTKEVSFLPFNEQEKSLLSNLEISKNYLWLILGDKIYGYYLARH